jgi:peptide-methionine (R)-S-oxide reductase
MSSRRQFLFVTGVALGFAPVLGWMGRSRASAVHMSDEKFPVTRTDEEWRRSLTPEQYKVLRDHGTERAFTSPLNA